MLQYSFKTGFLFNWSGNSFFVDFEVYLTFLQNPATRTYNEKVHSNPRFHITHL